MPKYSVYDKAGKYRFKVDAADDKAALEAAKAKSPNASSVKVDGSDGQAAPDKK
jgi:hypothetical protein